MVDNFDIIIPLLDFKSDDDFYFMQLIQRRKENPDIKANSRSIKNWQIRSIDQLLEYKPDIIWLANQFNARATICLNKRSKRECAYKTMSMLAEALYNNDFTSVDKLYAKVIGQNHNDDCKKWILDADDIKATDPVIDEIKDFINALNPIGDKFISVIPSRSGCHIITKPFDPRKYSEKYPHISIHKDNPTNIYIS